MRDPFQRLALVDPVLAQHLRTAITRSRLENSAIPPLAMVEDILWGLAQEVGFGQAIGQGYVALLSSVGNTEILFFQTHFRRGGEHGPTLGTLLARHLVPVLQSRDRQIRDQFLKTLDVMCTKGIYTLNRPLALMDKLLAAGDLKAVLAFLHMLAQVYHHPMTYGDSLHFSNRLPEALGRWHSANRWWQIEILAELGGKDVRLIDPFLQGMRQGLALLSPQALRRFTALAWERFRKNPEAGTAFLSLSSVTARQRYADEQVTVALPQVAPRLNRYLTARLKVPATVRAVSQLPPGARLSDPSALQVCSDGRSIFLPDEIGCYDTKSANLEFYRCLTRLCAAYFEFGTYTFDLEKFSLRGAMPQASVIRVPPGQNDWQLFCQAFPESALAADLVTLYEHGRLMHLMTQHYPGLVRAVKSVLIEAWKTQTGDTVATHPVQALYGWLALGQPPARDLPKRLERQFNRWVEAFVVSVTSEPTVDTTAEWVVSTYPTMAELVFSHATSASEADGYAPLMTPFDWRLRPEILVPVVQPYDAVVNAIRARLASRRLIAYRDEIGACLKRRQGKLSLTDLHQLIHPLPQHTPSPERGKMAETVDLTWLNLSDLLDSHTPVDLEAAATEVPVHWYPEWDSGLNEYLIRHVRISTPWVTGSGDDFYQHALQQHHGLIRRLRKAFELLKPQGLMLLRPWIEGDAFDYRALLDFAIDRKAGLMPSERLYIKRVKQQRDVAVLLLVDISRSTAHSVLNQSATVLDIEKEAIVLLCEALEVVGDRYAIAGFSGSGRLGVEYHRVKGFNQSLNPSVRRRISAMQSQRSTRMGAAIRHATTHLAQVPAKVHLLMVLSDGFPNDLDYKGAYAIRDTRKAINEARARRTYVKAITVNSVGDPQLDALYGNLHHTVISDVRELPAKLLQIYSSLTRM